VPKPVQHRLQAYAFDAMSTQAARNLRLILIIFVITCGLITLGPAPSAQADSGSQFTDAERDAVLARHNQERQAVGVPPLVWRNDLAADAQAWADRGTGQHIDVSKGERPQDQGESLHQAWGTPIVQAHLNLPRPAH
jgi:Cysteine-rich secretory protein family